MSKGKFKNIVNRFNDYNKYIVKFIGIFYNKNKNDFEFFGTASLSKFCFLYLVTKVLSVRYQL